jgi:hypothetical protein
MNWLTKKIVKGFGGGVIEAHTTLLAIKKELTPEGQNILVKGGYRAGELMLERPGLWFPTMTVRRRVKDKVVTDDFCEELVDTLQSVVAAFDDYKYHHSGEGVGVEGAGDAGLGTPREDARVVGTQVEGATTKTYKSIATITYTNTWAITEHGLFNAAGAGGPPVTGGVLMDRTKFAAINVVATNAIEFSFTISFASGG